MYEGDARESELPTEMTDEENRALILVLEDVEETRDGTEDLLRAEGYRVDPARNEADAIERARREPPALLLVSLAGSDADVIETARRVRERARVGEEVPIVIFSADTIAEGAEVDFGRNVHLTRPDNFDQLTAFIRRLLKRALPTAAPVHP